MRAARVFAALTGAVAAAQGVRALVNADNAVYGGTGSDYVAFATGGRLVAAGDRCLYCLGHQADVQAALLGARPGGPGFPHTFANAPLAAAAIAPVATRPLGDGLRIFEAILLVALIAAVVLAARLLRPALGYPALVVATLALTTVPADQGLLLAQWDPLLVLALVSGVLALRSGHGVAAGLLVSVLVIKPQAALLVLPALLLAGPLGRRAAVGFAAGTAVWWGSGLLLAGPAFPRDLVNLLRDTQANEGTVTAGLPALAGWTPAGNALVLPVGVVAVIVGLALLVRLRGRLAADPVRALAAGVVLSLLAAPHVFSDDLILLAPALLLIAQGEGPRRLSGIAGSLRVAVLALLLDAAWFLDEWVVRGPRALETGVTLLVLGLLLAQRSPRDGSVAWDAMHRDVPVPA